MTLHPGARLASGAPETELPAQPDEHCVEQLLQAAPQRGLTASEDIRDQRGMLLLAKGQAIDASLRERLIARRLARPLEASLEFGDALQAPEILACARRALDEAPALARFLGADTQYVVTMLGQVRVRKGPGVLLTALASNRPRAFAHSLAVAMLAIWITGQLERSDDAIRDAGEAGLMHDLGECYLPAEMLEFSGRLSFEAWRRMCVHPVIGSALVHESGAYPAAVVQAIREHHERSDGSGYPSGTTAISPLGRVLMSAEMLASLLAGEGHPLARARIALQMIPGQFPREVVDAVSRRLRLFPRESPAPIDPARLHQGVSLILQRLELAQARLRALAQRGGLGAAEQALLAQLERHVYSYIRALHDSGAHAMTAHPGWLADDPLVADEVFRIKREMAWQLPGLHRHAELMVCTRVARPQAWQEVLDALAIPESESVGPSTAPDVPDAGTGPVLPLDV